jgi:hypothetical protein
VSKPLVKKRKINEAQQSNEANATSNKETGKTSKKKSVGKPTGRSPASNLAKASKKESAPQSRARQDKAVATSSTVEPFLGKGVAFCCNSNFGKTLIKEFGKKWVPDAVSYHLDGKAGHVVGTVMRKSRGLGKKNGNETNNDVVWEFSALGETNVPYSYLLEGNKEADRLMIHRKIIKGGRKRKKTINEGQWLKDNLCIPSDDEKEMKVTPYSIILLQNIYILSLSLTLQYVLNCFIRLLIVTNPLVLQVVVPFVMNKTLTIGSYSVILIPTH